MRLALLRVCVACFAILQLDRQQQERQQAKSDLLIGDFEES